MMSPRLKKIGISVAVVFGIAAAYFSIMYLNNSTDDLIQEQLVDNPIEEVQEELPGIFSETVEDTSPESLLENMLYKRVDFINTMIDELGLNNQIESIFFQNGSKFVEITPDYLLSLNITQLVELKDFIQTHNLFMRDKNNDTAYVPLTSLSEETIIEMPIEETSIESSVQEELIK